MPENKVSNEEVEITAHHCYLLCKVQPITQVVAVKKFISLSEEKQKFNSLSLNAMQDS